jgi:hypothetical protein
MSEDIFTHVLPPGENPPDEAKFRIRLSVEPALADDLLRSAIPIIVSAGCPFKVTANTALLELVCSRSSAGEAAADFMIVYPPSEELFNDLTAKLQIATQGIKSAYVPKPPAETRVRTALTPDNPWPGLDSFLADENRYFCGREDEQLELAQCLERGSVTVVLGQPGAGKTSLLRAGLQPLFDRLRFEPVYLRLQCTGAVHPLQQVRDEINRVLRERQIAGAPFGEGQGLREYFHRQEPDWVAADGKLVAPVLIFDQFEDVFTFDGADPIAARQMEAFWKQIANLVENRVPETIGQVNRPSGDPHIERLGFKLMIGLRQDQLPELLQRGGQIPSITRSHFLLQPFQGPKAVEAVLGPGRRLLDPANPDALAEKIVRRVARETPPSSERPLVDSGDIEPLENLSVEPALLSFFCRQLNVARNRSRKSKSKPSLITAKLMEAEAGRILEDFFHRGDKARDVAPAPQPQATDLNELQEPAVEKLTEPKLELPLKEPSPTLGVSQVLAESPQSIDKVPDVAPTTPPHTTDSKEDRGLEVAKLAEAAPELPPKEPLKGQPGGPVLADLAQSSGKAPEAALAPPPQTTIPKQPQRLEVEKFPGPAPEPSSKEPLPARAGSYVVRRLKFLAYGLGLLLTIVLAVLAVLYIKEMRTQQTEVELEDYISHLAASRNTFKSANKKLTLAESNLALQESNILALAEKTREQELETQNAKEQNLRLAGEQTNFQSRINQLNREKAQAESRLAQWRGLVDGLTNQIANLNQQKDEWTKQRKALNKETEDLKSRNEALTATNAGTVSNLVENRPTNSTLSAENQEAATMESVPGKLPATTPDTTTFARRQVVVLLTGGQCLYSPDGTKFHALQVHDVLFEGAVIRTGKGSWGDLFIRRTGTTVRLAPESQIKIVKLSEAGENGVPMLDTLLELDHGRIFTVVRALAPGSTLEISDAAGHSVIEGGGLGCYMITAPGPEAADKLLLTPLRIVGQKGTSVVAPGQSYSAREGATLSLVPSYWEKMLIQLDELEAETDKAIAEPASLESSLRN